MAVASHIISPNRIAAAVCTLKNLGIPVRGPFVTQSQLSLYIIDDCIVARGELLALYDAGKLNPGNIRAVLSDLKRLQDNSTPEK